MQKFKCRRCRKAHAQDEAEKRYRSRIDELMNDKYQLEMKCREQARDISAYGRLVKGRKE